MCRRYNYKHCGLLPLASPAGFLYVRTCTLSQGSHDVFIHRFLSRLQVNLRVSILVGTSI